MQIDEAKFEEIGPDVRPVVRSQARIRYSKKPNDVPKQPEKIEKTWRERIVIQAIICGCFLSVLLGFSIIDSAFTNNVTSWVEHNLSFDFLAEEDGVGAWASRVVDIFRPDDAAVINYVEGLQNPGDSWIDPYILDEINSTE